MTRISTFANSQLTLSRTLDTQRQMLDLQVQVSTGKKSQNYSAISTEAFRLVSLESAQARTKQYETNIAQVDKRLEVIETSVGQIFDVASRFKTVLQSALNGDGVSQLDTAQEAATARAQVAGLLNVQYGDRYLFSGTRTDTRPVELDGWTLPALPLTPPLATVEADYYRGDQVKLAVEADKDLNVTYGITADEPAFEYVLRAMHYVETAGTPADRDALETALALINSALGTNSGDAALGADTLDRDLADLRANIGTTRKTLQDTATRLSDFSLYLDQSIGDIENVDVAAAISQLAVQQAQLEASYMTLARLSQLSLTQFL
jgi:flagellar hook-associated protein 3 FlgL